MPARTRKIRHDDETRAKIKTSQIINRLTGHILGQNDMPASAVTAALGLLRKVLPDLTAAENTTEHVHRYVARVPQKGASPDEWQQQHAPQTTLQ